MERLVADGWRYLGLPPAQILAMTPREFAILMRAETERRYDEFEKLATVAMWNHAAYRAKRLKKSDLFKRPKDDEQKERKSIQEMRQEVDEMNEWLSKLTVERKG